MIPICKTQGFGTLEILLYVAGCCSVVSVVIEHEILYLLKDSPSSFVHGRPLNDCT